MNITVKRTYNNSLYCIGHVYADGKYICDSIEDTDRGWDKNTPIDKIKAEKVYAKSAIPVGKYSLTIDVQSPTFVKKIYYKNYCNGKVPRVLDVPGFSGILIHRGKSEKDSAGCLIVGYNKIKGQVVNSQEAFEKLYTILKEAKRRNEKLTITYERTYECH